MQIPPVKFAIASYLAMTWGINSLQTHNHKLNNGVACGPGFTVQILAPAIAPEGLRGLWVFRCNP
jgi:hypothetical protein